MKIHEHQAKTILAKYGVAVPRGEVATSKKEAEDIAKRLMDNGASGVVVKAQIHAGGRGKGGGVKVAKSVEEAGAAAPRRAPHRPRQHLTFRHKSPAACLVRAAASCNDPRSIGVA
jgi:succinyl-CoA synthetase beta subunit